MLIYCVVTIVVVCCNPILAYLALRFTGDEYVFVRFMWVLPVFALMAYAAMKFILSFSGKGRAVVLAVICILILLGGELWPDVYRKAENAYKMDSDIVEACNIIKSDVASEENTNVFGHVSVCLQLPNNNIYQDGSAANLFYFGVRQYAPEFELSYVVVTEENYENPAFSYEGYLTNSSQYAICENQPGLDREYQRIGYEQIGTYGSYAVYKNNFRFTLFVVRHSQTNGNVANRVVGAADGDWGIVTEEGEAKALELGESLKNAKISASYSSSASRAIRTAELVLQGADRSEVVNQPSAALKDIGWGAAEEMTWDDIHAQYGELSMREIFGDMEAQEYHGPIPYTDNLFDYLSYLTSGVNNVVTESAAAGLEDGQVLLVSHSAFHWWLERNLPGESVPPGLDNTSLTILQYDCGVWSAVTINNTDYKAIPDIIADLD
jgi:broad specificity phosphatase PhoE